MSQKSGFFSFLKDSIPSTIIAIGVSSLLINASTSVIFAGSALYLKTVLGVSAASIGFLEAIVEAIAYAVRIFSGVISDYFKRRKTLMIIGYAMVTISKPLLALSHSFVQIFLARALDRVGNGIQASPRDALIGDEAPKKTKGACFGLRQSLSVAGSTLGAILGIVVMKLSNNNFELMFFLAGIPAVVAVFILIAFVKEKKHPAHDRRKIRFKDAKLLGKKFWVLMAVVTVFMLGRFTEIFITLHACETFKLDLAYGTAISAIYNLISAFVSYPAGRISDKMDRTTLLLIGFFLLLLSHVLLGFAINLYMVFLGATIWGAQIGITQSIFATLVSDYVPKDLRGSGFGVYYLVVAVSSAVASALAGILYEGCGASCTFKTGAVFCCTAITILCFSKKFLKSYGDGYQAS